MNKSLLLLLRTALFPSRMSFKLRSRGLLYYRRQRINQYLKGIDSLSSVINNVDSGVSIAILDNTVGSPEDIPKAIRDRLPNGVQFLCTNQNKKGVKNKGAGDIEMWRKFQDSLRNYELTFQYNPRLRLERPDVLADLIESRREFVAPDDRGGARTGYFCLRTGFLLEFALSIDVEDMVKSGVGVEALMEQYLLQNKMQFTDVPCLATRFTGLRQKESPY